MASNTLTVKVELVPKQLDMVLITRTEYDRLLAADMHLGLLEALGVDNWQGYCTVPPREDYESEEAWLEDYERTCSGVYA